MDTNILLWIAGGVFAVVSWLSKRTIDANERHVEQLQKEVQSIKIDYLHKNEFKEFKQELHSMFKDLKEDIRSLNRAE